MNLSSCPKFSVITINLNNKEGLRKTIESVLSQTLKDFEYIVIDGGSTDGSVDVISEYQSRINYSVSEKDSGIYNAMNKGIKTAKGEYLLFLNSGDWLFDAKVLESATNLIDPDAAVCSADIYINDGKSLEYYTSPSSIDFNYLYNGSLSHPSTFIQKIMFDKYGPYNELNRIASDWEFFFLILIIKAEKYQKLPIALSVFNLEGISNQKHMETTIDRERKEALDRFIPKALHLELLSLKAEAAEYKNLKEKFGERRFLLLSEIEKNALLRRIVTILLLVMSKLAKFFP